MVTGDNLQTAKAIALECGILASDAADATEPNLIEGKSFRSKSEAERAEIAEKISVCAVPFRKSPSSSYLTCFIALEYLKIMYCLQFWRKR